MVGLELFETAAEDFRATLEHGEASLNRGDKHRIKAELEDAEWRAKEEGSKEQDHYATLGECSYYVLWGLHDHRRRMPVSLGLNRICTAVEIKKAYRMQSLKHHPDKVCHAAYRMTSPRESIDPYRLFVVIGWRGREVQTDCPRV